MLTPILGNGRSSSEIHDLPENASESGRYFSKHSSQSHDDPSDIGGHMAGETQLTIALELATTGKTS